MDMSTATDLNDTEQDLNDTEQDSDDTEQDLNDTEQQGPDGARTESGSLAGDLGFAPTGVDATPTTAENPVLGGSLSV